MRSSISTQRVVVCGTTFGQVYLEALSKPGLPFELAGVLAKGSERSQACAEHYGVPLFTSVEQLPENIDIACVVVRSSLLGGHGTELAQSLMARGIHVLQEHPLHHDELAECFRQARRHKVHYYLNSFYSHLPTVQRFNNVAQVLFKTRRALHIDAVCSFQVAHSLLEILWTVLGKIRPWAFDSKPPSKALHTLCDGEVSFRSLEGVFAGLPLFLRIQNQMDPRDPDNYIHLFHRITLGTNVGDLSLVTTYGPIVWSARPEIPRVVRDSDTRDLFANDRIPSNDTATMLLGPAEEPSQHVIFRSMWPEAVRRALMEFSLSIRNGGDLLQRGQSQLTLCRVWQDLTNELGPTELIRRDLPARGLSVKEINEMRSAAASVE